MKITFIGGGNMGEAILAALLKKNLAVAKDITVSDVVDTRRHYIMQKFMVAVSSLMLKLSAAKTSSSWRLSRKHSLMSCRN